MQNLQNNWSSILLLILGAIAWYFRGKTQQLQNKIEETKTKEQVKEVDQKTAELKKVSDDAEKNLHALVTDALAKYDKFKGGNDVR